MNGNPFLPEAPYHEHGSSQQILTWPNDRFYGVNTAQVLSLESCHSYEVCLVNSFHACRTLGAICDDFLVG